MYGPGKDNSGFIEGKAVFMTAWVYGNAFVRFVLIAYIIPC